MANTFEPEKLLLFDQEKFGPPSMMVCWDHPPHEAAAEAHYSDTEQCLVVERGGDARAYPLYLIASHHLASDVLGGKETLITF
jgi:hypothetical protein